MLANIFKKSIAKQITFKSFRTYANNLTSTVTSEEFKEIMENFEPEKKVVFLDVREDEELEGTFLPSYNSSGIKLRLVRIPILDLVELQLNALEEFKDSHQIIWFCRGGNKSVAATRILKLHGYNAINLKGGIRLLSKVVQMWKHGKQSFRHYYDL